MVRVIEYLDLLRRGAGKFVRQLNNGYILVSNKKVAERSFVLINALVLSELLKRAGLFTEATELSQAVAQIKETNRALYSQARKARTLKDKKV